MKNDSIKDILSEMGAIYTGAEINKWMAYHYAHNTPYKKDAVNLMRAYGNFGIPWPDRRYMICRTDDYPKSAASNGNRDGAYMLRRVSFTKNRGKRNQKKRWREKQKNQYSVKFVPVRNDTRTFFV